MVRIVQQNDWVAFILIGCIFLYMFMLLYLQRDSSVKVFLFQKHEDSSNNFLSWLIVSVVYCAVFATVISPFVPIVPRVIREIQLFGYELNKVGYTLLVVGLFYFVKSFLSYLFFAGTGSGRRWTFMQFAASKFYLVFSFLLMIVCIFQYYYPVDPVSLFEGYILGFLTVFLFKIFIYILSPLDVLPEKWYYKFLYICTLQIAPMLLLWRVLYF